MKSIYEVTVRVGADPVLFDLETIRVEADTHYEAYEIVYNRDPDALIISTERIKNEK